MRTHALIATLLPALILAAFPAEAQPRKSFVFTPSSRNGVCMVSFPGTHLPGSDKPYQLQFSYRVRDGNFGVSLLVNGWDKAQANADSETVRPMTLVFDSGKSTTSRSGGYSSGFNDEAWAGWGAGAGSDAAFAMLPAATSVKVKFDGADFGTVDLQMKGLAHVSLTQCAERVKAGQE
jgi:hypothetical protein